MNITPGYTPTGAEGAAAPARKTQFVKHHTRGGGEHSIAPGNFFVQSTLSKRPLLVSDHLP